MLLNCHSYYSFHYGTVSPKQLLKIAVRAGAQSVALTDVNSSAACLEFLRQSREFDVHPVVGIDFKVKAQTKYVALARNNEGFREINKHLSQQLMGARTERSLSGEEILDEAPDFSHAYIIYPLSNAPNRNLKENEFVGIAPTEIGRAHV